jgi:hypothetical protein
MSRQTRLGPLSASEIAAELRGAAPAFRRAVSKPPAKPARPMKRRGTMPVAPKVKFDESEEVGLFRKRVSR